MSKIDATVVVILDEVAFAMAKNDKCVPPRPQHTTIPATMSKHRPASIDPAPGEALQV
jgi:hypothetical protein